MTTLSENVFDALALARKSKKSVIHSTTGEDKDDDATTLSVSNPEPINGDETSWTVQSSTKRRLAPQYTLSKNDLGVDSPKNKAALQEISKKKVTRYTREEILAIRVPTKVLPELIELTDIISVEALPPVTSFPFDFEDFNRIWNAGNASKDAIVRGRVSGRSRGGKNGDDGDGGGDNDNWGQGQDKGDLWDSSHDHNTISEGFDLSDFAEMADKFRKDTKDLVKSKLLLGNDEESYLKIKMREDEAMERLLREQSESEGLGETASDLLLADDSLPIVEEDDEELPDWAREESEDEQPHNETMNQDFTSDAKRNILLETLNVKLISEQNLNNRVETVSKSVILPPSLDTSAVSTSNKALGSPSPFSFQAEDPLLTESASMVSNANAPAITASATVDPTTVSIDKPNLPAKSSLETTYLSTVDLSHVLGDLFPQQNLTATVIASQQIVPNAIPAASTVLKVSNQSALQGPPQPDMWEYLDPQNAVQGPFTSKGMRRWLESGYFKMNLPVRLKGWSRFYPLGIVYTNIDTAFQQLMPEPINEQQRRQQAILEQQREQAVLEHQKQQALLEQHREQIILEQRRQQALLEQQRDQAILEQRRQQVILEQQREQVVLEQQRQQVQRRERAKLEQQRYQAQEQQRQQQTILEQQRQQILLEQQKQQVVLEQQRHEQQMQQTALAQKKLASSESAAPWIDRAPKSIQKGLNEIQSEEDKLAEKRQSQSKEQIPMSMKLKSLLGVSVVSGITSSSSNTTVWTANEKANPNQVQPTKSLKDFHVDEALEIQKQQQLLQQQQQQQQQQYQKRLQHQKHEEQAHATAAAAALTPSVSPSWAGQPIRTSRIAATFKSASLKEIISQEENQLETEDSNDRNSNSWAAKIAVPKSPLSSTRKDFTGAVTTATSHTNTDVNSSSTAIATSDSKPTTISKMQSIVASTTKSSKSEFGGSGLSADLEEFCLNSMQKLNGSDDITLLQFCMSLKSPVEVREYLAAYLGSKPEVSQFATEFIKRKEASGIGGSGSAGSTIVYSSNRLPATASAPPSSGPSFTTKSATTSVNSGSDKSVPKKSKKVKSEN